MTLWSCRPHAGAISSAAVNLSPVIRLRESWGSGENTPIWWRRGRWSAHTHETHISTHLIERSSALHSCLFAVLTLQSSAAVVTPIYNWYPQRGMGLPPVFEGLGSKVEHLDNFLPLFQGAGWVKVVGDEKKKGEDGFLNGGKTSLTSSPYCSHTRWPSEQNNVLSFLHNLAKLHLLSDCHVDRHPANPY